MSVQVANCLMCFITMIKESVTHEKLVVKIFNVAFLLFFLTDIKSNNGELLRVQKS